MNKEWMSAHLDGELSDSEAVAFDAALVADPEIAEALAELARVRSLLRNAVVDPPEGALDRIFAAVQRDVEPGGAPLAPVVPLTSRRRIPTFAAVAAVLVIIASVVGGVGGADSLPALGDLVAQHEAAAAVVDGAPMPDDMGQLAMHTMPIDDAMNVGPVLPTGFSMQLAFANESTVQLVYVTTSGDPISVFRHEGDADLGELDGGSISRSDDGDMWSTDRLEAYVAVMDGTGYVWIVVSAEPHDAMMGDLMHDLPSRSPTVGERLRETAEFVVEPFRFWS